MTTGQTGHLGEGPPRPSFEENGAMPGRTRPWKPDVFKNDRMWHDGTATPRSPMRERAGARPNALREAANWQSMRMLAHGRNWRLPLRYASVTVLKPVRFRLSAPPALTHEPGISLCYSRPCGHVRAATSALSGTHPGAPPIFQTANERT